MTYLLLLQIWLLVLVLATNDPLLEGFGVPAEAEQFMGAGIVSLSTWFIIWKQYLNPLKKNVEDLQIGVSSLVTDMDSVKKDVHLVKEKLIKG